MHDSGYGDRCLTLEYGISASAVARCLIISQSPSSVHPTVFWSSSLIVLFRCRSWATKVTYSIVKRTGHGGAVDWLDMRYFSVLAAMIQAACTCILLYGLKANASLINCATMFKISLVVFMTISAFCAFDQENLHPFVVCRAPHACSAVEVVVAASGVWNDRGIARLHRCFLWVYWV